MLITFGTLTKEIKLGRSKKMIKCEHCGNIAYWSYIHIKQYSTIYSIPILPLPSRKVFRCPTCSFGVQVTKSNIHTVLPYINLFYLDS